jgi:hypothetical protein
MKISYAITVCDEINEIQKLISFLIKNKYPQDEITILYDIRNGSSHVEEYLRAHCINNEFIWYPYDFDGHFADMKNHLTSLCSGDFIFQIDADEIPHKTLMDNIHQIIEMNDVDVILVPRVNTVEGLTGEQVQKWGWVLDENGWVNWPDPQWRIYRNVDYIKWENKVHENLIGYKTISNLPMMQELALHHPKTIERQVKQNEYYETL